MNQDNEKIQKKLKQAQQKIQQLRQFKERLESRDFQSSLDDQLKIKGILDIIVEADNKASRLMFEARLQSSRLMEMSDQIRSIKVSSRDPISGVASGLGKLVGGLGHGLANTVQSITDGAVPITKSVLNTATNVADSMVGAATSLSGTLLKGAQGTATNLINTSKNTASSLIGQTSNLASSLTTMASGAIGKIVGSGTEAAGNLISGILNPKKQGGEPSGISSMLSTASSAAQGVVQTAQQAASGLLATATNIVNGPDGKGGLVSSVSSLAKNVTDSVGGLANTLLGSSASSLIDGAGGVLGGLFGKAADIGSSALAAGGNAVSAATNLLGGLADGCAGLAGSVMDAASSTVGSLADAALDVAGGMLNAASNVGSSLIDAASSVAGSALDAAADIGGAMMDTIGDLASGIPGIGDVAAGLADFAGDALESAAGLADAVIDAAAGLAEGALDVATDIAEGIVDAASDVVDALVGDTQDDVQDVVDTMDEGIDNTVDDCENMQQEYNQDNWDTQWTSDDEYWEEHPYDYSSQSQEGNNDNNGGGQGSTTPTAQQNNTSNSPGADKSGASEDSQSSTPQGWDSPQENVGRQDLKGDKDIVSGGKWGWEADVKAASGLIGMMHDGDQVLFNPYGHGDGLWTVYSFRPCDAAMGYPQIAITPASFQALDSMNTLLDNIPYIVVKEFFFKNTASTMINFVKKIAGAVQEAKNNPGDSSTVDNSDDANSKTSGDLKSKANAFMAKIKEIFYGFDPKMQVIDIPYLLYCGLRKKTYGNTYIFPYIVDNGTTINKASNDSEWNGNNGGILGMLQGFLSGFVEQVGGFAASLTGSQGRPVANLFPAPNWGGMGGDKAQFKFDLMLINDNALFTRNNYMCANTIIHHNRAIQKAVMAFPGALYEIWLPTGQRHLMCTGTFDLSPLGLNRYVPDNFFDDTGVSGANFQIGTKIVAPLENVDSRDKTEVIPDGYKLSIEFKSCLANNMNTAVFQYYVKMTGYENYGKEGEDGRPGSDSNNSFSDKTANAVTDYLKGKGVSDAQEESKPEEAAPKSPTTNEAKMVKLFSRAIRDLVETYPDDTDGVQEKFDEATYNKRLAKIKSQFGDLAINSDSAVQTIRNTQRSIRETSEFLNKLYGANDQGVGLWYKPDSTEELYTTIEPDYRKILRKRYGQTIRELKQVQEKIATQSRKIERLESKLSEVVELSARDELIEKKIGLTDKLDVLMREMDELSDNAMKIDVDLIQAAYDDHDRAVSLKRRMFTPQIFRQVWNEKIMNKYEMDKIQYLTSEEKKRYFDEKIRELSKYDKHHILNHPDWFFRVVVVDFVQKEMQRLILWFKDCSYTDFDTIYRIIRKLNLLQMDLDLALSQTQNFNINHTNLFCIKDEDIQDFTRIDGMLVGNTLYELFVGQLSSMFVRIDDSSNNDDEKEEPDEEQKKLKEEQTSELEVESQRTVRQDIVRRYWKSEENLTIAAYKLSGDISSMENDGANVLIDEKTMLRFKDLKELKSNIIRLKLKGNRSDKEETQLKGLLGSYVDNIRYLKEWLVMQKMQEMQSNSKNEYNKESENVNAPV